MTITKLSVYLDTSSRYDHLCWGHQSGEVMVLGGAASGKTTEKVSAEGTSSSQGFDLPFNVV